MAKKRGRAKPMAPKAGAITKSSYKRGGKLSSK